MSRCYFIVLFLVFVLPTVLAIDYPSYQGWVNDYASVLTSDQRALLTEVATLIEENTSAEVVFVSVNSTAPRAPQEYRTGLFRAWHIGKADKDNGLLILYAVQEHRLEIEVGYGLEGILPDGKIGRFLDEYYVPLRDEGNVSEGIVAVALALSEVIVEHTDEVRSGYTTGMPDWFAVLIIIVVVGCFVLIGWYSFTHPSARRSSGFFIGGFGSGGSSSGFSGFGGGMSGGGGAGR